MSPPKLRQEIEKAIDQIPVDRLESLAEFVQFLSRPPLVRQMQQAEKDIAAGKGVPWQSVRGDV